jgi:hypothetical protein
MVGRMSLLSPTPKRMVCGLSLLNNTLKTMTERNFKQELYYSYYEDMEDGRTTETIDYAALIGIIAELCDRIEQLEKDNNLLKSYAWEQ